MAVEHWDNLQHKPNHPNLSGHTMIDGPTEANDLELTEVNRNLIRSYFDEILANGQFSKLDHYIDSEDYTEHNPDMADGLSALSEFFSRNSTMKIYNTLHRVLAEGSFVLSIGEGFLNAVHSSFYDLFRVSENKIVEHWDTIDAIPPCSEWKNNNGKF
jgi:predicted SnoaL-like aldol condensation-catalyzing enzyme